MATKKFVAKNGLISPNAEFTGNVEVTDTLTANLIIQDGTSLAILLDSAENTAYTNAVSDATSLANDAYSNAVSDATSLASDAYSNAVSDATSLAGNAYSNAVSDATSLASDAYSNAVSYTDAEIANLVNTAPTVLDTLNELAAAINDDPEFANSVAGQISTAYSNAISYTDTEIINLNLGSISTQDANSVNITGGSITIDSLTASDITYPSADGSNGQVIATDGSGTLSFTDLPPSSDTFARTLSLWSL